MVIQRSKVLKPENADFKLDYKAITLKNLHRIHKIQEYCTEEQIHVMHVVGTVLPFKTNNYVIEQLIDWNNPKGLENDPLYILNFPQREMLRPEHFTLMETALERGDKAETLRIANQIRLELNPQPAGQKTHNVPHFANGIPLEGMQHKYHETVLFFPQQGQTCYSHCTFCFRWPQFVGVDDLKFANRQAQQLVEYVQEHHEISDILFTGGDPMVMRAKTIQKYINPLLEAKIPHLRTIRFGTKSLSYWPYKFLLGNEAEEVLSIFSDIYEAGIHTAFMVHFNHPNELKTRAIRQASELLRKHHVHLRTQSPLLQHINAHPDIWAEMWRTQVSMGMIPYYFFVVRDTGARRYFEVPLVEAWQIFKDAYKQVSGISRTVRGPSMSAFPGKVQIVGTAEVKGEKVIVLIFIQGRNPDWVGRPFFAQYDEKAGWLDELRPAFSQEKFFFETELDKRGPKAKEIFHLDVQSNILKTTDN